MTDKQPIHLPDFAATLRREVARILTDPAFARAPVQSKLLSYLAERSIEGGKPPSQYEVAVDGLGRPENYDMESDSYPRVQISRLRKNLENYYTRVQPEHGARVEVDSGAYRLLLVKEEPAASTPPAVAHPELHQPAMAVARSAENAINRKLVMAGAIAAAIALALLFFRSSSDDGAGGIAAASVRPAVAVRIDTRAVDQEIVFPEDLPARTRRTLQKQLAGSFVSRLADEAEGRGPADYEMRVNFGFGETSPFEAFISLVDGAGVVRFRDTLALDPDDPEAFLNMLEARLVYMTSPVGTIARNEVKRFADPKASDYGCFLHIEQRRSDGIRADGLLDECIDLYPRSYYRSYWLARRAFHAYQADVVAGRPIRRDGQGWQDLQDALESDRFNAFANYIAAKIELADGNCENAATFVARAFERGTSYPTLVSAMEVDAASCTTDRELVIERNQRIGELIRANPDPDPLLHLYLVFTALAIGDEDLAQQIASSIDLVEPSGAVQEVSALMRRAVLDPDFAVSNEDELRKNIRLFVWNERANEQIVERLVTRSELASGSADGRPSS